jgi:hypothetical protein
MSMNSVVGGINSGSNLWRFTVEPERHIALKTRAGGWNFWEMNDRPVTSEHSIIAAIGEGIAFLTDGAEC